jgi:inner membrane protein
MEDSMRWMLLLKTVVISFLSLVLLIPLFMVMGLVESRNARNQQVRQSVAGSAAGRQQLAGPVLVATYRQRVTVEEKDEASGKTVPRVKWVQRSQVMVPRDLQIRGEAKVEERHRGLYKAQLFHLNGNLSGTFALPAGLGLPFGSADFEPGRLQLVVGLSDLRAAPPMTSNPARSARSSLPASAPTSVPSRTTPGRRSPSRSPWSSPVPRTSPSPPWRRTPR